VSLLSRITTGLSEKEWHDALGKLQPLLPLYAMPAIGACVQAVITESLTNPEALSSATTQPTGGVSV